MPRLTCLLVVVEAACREQTKGAVDGKRLRNSVRSGAKPLRPIRVWPLIIGGSAVLPCLDRQVLPYHAVMISWPLPHSCNSAL
jgi:hypothetical protein